MTSSMRVRAIRFFSVIGHCASFHTEAKLLSERANGERIVSTEQPASPRSTRTARARGDAGLRASRSSVARGRPPPGGCSDRLGGTARTPAQLRSALAAAYVRAPCAERCDARLEPARRDELKEQLTETLVDGGATEADTVRAAGLEVAGAQVTRRGAALAPVAHPQLVSATRAALRARSAGPARRAPQGLRRRRRSYRDCRA